MNTPSDEVLAARARDGDEEAFRALFTRHSVLLRDRVRRSLPDRLRRRVSVADVLQEVGIVAYERRGAFDEKRGPYRNWLLGILDRKISETLRRHVGAARRDAGREVTRGGRVDTANFAGRGPSPSEAAVGGETEERLRRAFESLAEADRRVIHLVREEGLRLAEAARRMERSLAAGKRLYARAMHRWKNAFESERR